MTETIRLTTAQALVRWLQAQFSERDGTRQRAIPSIFGIFGHGNVLGVAQAIDEAGAALPLYQPKNEQSMVHTALGFAKASRRLATLACTASIGPGATNMITGAATATTNRLPVLLLPSDTFANRRQGNVLQQLEHPVDADLTVNDVFRPVSRFFDRIARPEQLLTALPQAMRVLLDPAETGAVTISLHQDVQGEASDWPLDFFDERTWIVARPRPDRVQVSAAAAVIASATSPLIIAGGGVRYSAAEAALLAFAERLGIPVAETSAGKGAMPADSGWNVGGVGVNGTRVAAELARTADVVICVGTRLTDFTTGSHSLFQNPGVRFVGVNVNAADAYKLSSTPVVGDAREALESLGEALSPLAGSGQREQELRTRMSEWREALRADIVSQEGVPTQGEVLATINASTIAGDWVVAAAGWQPGDLLKMWETPAGSFTHIEFGFSCMGHEIPAGLGIRLHAGSDPGEVFVVIGDGTYLMNPTELVTAAQEGLKITVILLDNHGYQSISRLAMSNTGRSVGNELRGRGSSGLLPDGDYLTVDFAANARSMGVSGVDAASLDDLRTALENARAGSVSSVIVVPVAAERPLPGNGVFWDLGAPEVSSDPGTRERSEGFAALRSSSQRTY